MVNFERLTRWVRDLHAANLRALRRAAIQGADGDIDPYALELLSFCEAAGIEPPDDDPAIVAALEREEPP